MGAVEFIITMELQVLGKLLFVATVICCAQLATAAANHPQAKGSLQCYYCEEDCMTVDDSTDIIGDQEDYKSCQTTRMLASNRVTRGGNFNEHPDGECIVDSYTELCWCNTNLCNDQ